MLKIKSLKPLDQVEYKCQQMYTVWRAGKGVGFLQLNDTILAVIYIFQCTEDFGAMMRKETCHFLFVVII